KAAAAQRLAVGQAQLDLGLAARSESVPLPITCSKAAQMWDALCCAYDVLGFDEVTGGGEVFRQLVLARIIEPTSKLDAARVLTGSGVASVSYRNVKRRLPVISTETEPTTDAEVLPVLDDDAAEKLDQRIRSLAKAVNDQLEALQSLLEKAKQGQIHGVGL